MALVELHEVHKRFRSRRSLRLSRQDIHALQGVSLSIDRGETVAVVGESGSGKSTLGRIALRLLDADEGRIVYDGTDITNLEGGKLRALRRDIQMIFQDPFASLDPRMTIGQQIEEPLVVHGIVKTSQARRARVIDLMEQVGLARYQLERFPYEFSGGQLQRVAIARALATNPSFIVCDEPVAALDMSIRAQVINLLLDIQRESKIALLFITHDLSLVPQIADQVAVMCSGELVELGSTERVLDNPQHGYTRTLLNAIPNPDPRQRRFR